MTGCWRRSRSSPTQHGLVIEPGRNVIEVRSPGMSKGHAVETLVGEQDAGGFLFAGDDLGDLDAFEAVEDLREQGMPTLLVCSLSDEESALAERADVLVKGPDGVLDLLPPAHRATPADRRRCPCARTDAIQHAGPAYAC